MTLLFEGPPVQGKPSSIATDSLHTAQRSTAPYYISIVPCGAIGPNDLGTIRAQRPGANINSVCAVGRRPLTCGKLIPFLLRSFSQKGFLQMNLSHFLLDQRHPQLCDCQNHFQNRVTLELLLFSSFVQDHPQSGQNHVQDMITNPQFCSYRICIMHISTPLPVEPMPFLVGSRLQRAVSRSPEVRSRSDDVKFQRNLLKQNL